MAYIDAYKKLYGTAPATFGANVYDAGLLLANAVPVAAKSAKPGTVEFRKALRDALEQTKEVVGTQGVYNMTPQDHSGFDSRGRELITVKNGDVAAFEMIWSIGPETGTGFGKKPMLEQQDKSAALIPSRRLLR